MPIFPGGVSSALAERDSWRRAEAPSAKRSATPSWGPLEESVLRGSGHYSGLISRHQAYKDSPWIQPSIHTFASACAARPFRMFREIGKAKDQLASHWLINLMERPNPRARLSSYLLKYQTFALYDLDGEVLWYAPRNSRGKIDFICVFRKHEARPVPLDGQGEFLGWEITIDGRWYFADRDDVVHFTYFDPISPRPAFNPFLRGRDGKQGQQLSPNRGRSPLESKRLAITTDLAMSRYNADWFGRGIGAQYAFIGPAGYTPTDQTKDEYRDKLNARLSGRNGGVVVVDGDWKIQPLAASQKDAEFSQGRANSKAEQLAGLAPPVAMGDTGATYTNTQQQMQMFYELIVDPALIHACATIDVSLLDSEPDVWTELATDDVDALQAAKRERIKSAADLAEKRVPWDVAARMTGLDMEQFEGSNLAFGKYTDIPVSDILLGHSKAEVETVPPANAPKAPDETNEPPSDTPPPADSVPRFIRVVAPQMVSIATRTVAEDQLSALLQLIRSGDTDLQDIARRFHILALTEGAKQIGDLVKVDSLIGIDNPKVQEFLDTRANLITSVNKTTGDQILEAVKAGMRAGETPEAIATGIKRVYNTRKSDADFIARQETGSALNGGRFLQMKEEDVQSTEWMSSRDDKVRETHAPGTGVDGEVVALGEQFSNGCAYPQDPDGPIEEVMGCFPAETSVHAERIQRGFRCFYTGQLVTIKTALGHEVSGTSNHPILTSRGFVPLGSLTVGDRIFSSGGTQGMGVRDPNVQGAPSRLDETFDAMAKLHGVERVLGRRVNFYGDRPDGDVDVVTAHGELLNGGESATGNPVRENILSGASLGERHLLGDGLLGSDDCGRLLSPQAVMGGAREIEPLLNREAGHALTVGGAAVTDLNSGSDQARPDGATRDTESVLESQFGFPGDVPSSDLVEVDVAPDTAARLDATLSKAPISNGEADVAVLDDLFDALASDVVLDHVVDVSGRSWSGHVYTLQTASGMYLANGIVARNCRCIGLPAAPDGQRFIRSEEQRVIYWRKAMILGTKNIEKRFAGSLGRYFNDQRGVVLAEVAKMLAV